MDPADVGSSTFSSEVSVELFVDKDGCRKEKEGGTSSRSREIINSRELMK